MEGESTYQEFGFIKRVDKGWLPPWKIYLTKAPILQSVIADREGFLLIAPSLYCYFHGLWSMPKNFEERNQVISHSVRLECLLIQLLFIRITMIIIIVFFSKGRYNRSVAATSCFWGSVLDKNVDLTYKKQLSCNFAEVTLDWMKTTSDTPTTFLNEPNNIIMGLKGFLWLSQPVFPGQNLLATACGWSACVA